MSGKPVDQVQRIESHAYPAFHVGFLDKKQEGALEQFEALVVKKGLYTPAEGGKPASHDDETLLRYLRARKWDVQAAYAQFADTEKWRKENQIDKLYEQIDVDEYDVGKRLYPQWTGRRDKRGIPLYLFEVSNLTQKAVAAFENAKAKPGEVQSKLPPKMLRLFALYESLMTFALPLCSMIPGRPYPQTPISQSSNIVDISNVSLKQFWNLKTHMQDASTLATAHYPETLDRIFIIGAPYFFPTVWGWIKRWFDPITVSKIFILSKATQLETLKEFIDIDDIPKKYGGNLDYNFGDSPNIDHVIQSHLKWLNPDVVAAPGGAAGQKQNNFPTGPIQWRRSAGHTVAVAVGSVNGQRRSVEVAEILQETQGHLDALTRLPTPQPPLVRYSSGINTHPPSPPEGEREGDDLSNPPSGSSSPEQTLQSPTSTLQPPTSGTSNDVALAVRTSGPTGTTNSIREGTTATRYEQQAQTHGHGRVGEVNPETRETSYGDKHGVMDPKTISQAPKEHPVPEAEQPAPGIVDQVKDAAAPYVAAAGSAAASVAGYVGLGGAQKTQDEGKEEAVAVRDEQVDAAAPEKVEEFLRAQHGSHASKA